MKKHGFAKRAIVLLVCVCLAATFLFSAWFAAAHIHHDCTGHDCPVCMVIQRLSDMLRKLGNLVILLASSFLAALTALHGAAPYRSFEEAGGITPVSLKVQLNN